jgi:hypothetical protein
MRNDYEVVGDAVVIHLQGGKQTIVDAEDLPKLLELPVRWTHYMRPHGKECVQCSLPIGRVNGKLQYQVIQLHRYIVDAPSNIFIDHKDGNGLNNRKSNLRFMMRGMKRCKNKNEASLSR